LVLFELFCRIFTIFLEISHFQTDKERLRIETEFNDKSGILEGKLDFKSKEVTLLQKELKGVKEFRKNKTKITEEIKDMHEKLESQKAENEKNKQKMEHKFFVEQMKMEREVSLKQIGTNF